MPLLVHAEEAERSLPMSPIVYGIIAFCGFLLALAVLWSFRNTAQKVPKRHRANDSEHHG